MNPRTSKTNMNGLVKCRISIPKLAVLWGDIMPYRSTGSPAVTRSHRLRISLCTAPASAYSFARTQEPLTRLGRNAVRTLKSSARLWFVVPVLIIAAYVGSQSVVRGAPLAAGKPAAAASETAWPRAAVPDPTTLGFTRTELDALDARMKQAVPDGGPAGMTNILLRTGQVRAFKSFGRQ